MSGVELAFGAIGVADVCLRYGKELLDMYRAFRNAGESVAEKILVVEAMWSKTALQIDFMRRVAHTVPPEHRRVQERILDMLNMRFRAAISKLESVAKKKTAEDEKVEPTWDGPPAGLAWRGIRPWKYMIVRESLDDTVAGLEKWQQVFDPTWFLMLRIGDRLIDAELAREPEGGRPPSPSASMSDLTLVSSTASSRAGSAVESARKLRGTIRGSNSSRDNSRNSNSNGGGEQPITVHIRVNLPDEGLDWDSARALPYSTTRMVERAQGSKPGRVFMVDSIACGGSSGLDVKRARADAEALARKLKQIDPHTRLGVLPCHGLVKRRDPTTKRLASLDLFFSPPPAVIVDSSPDGTPTSLRDHLVRASRFSLSRRLDVARRLAEAVSFVHTCDFVHKNVRPEAVLVFPDRGRGVGGGDGSALGPAYLLGFDSFRGVAFRTLRTGDAAWERNLYRHPLRQGLRAHEDYVMQHDVYSLGVCLLELGLWRSFVDYGESESEEDLLDDGEKRSAKQTPGPIPRPSAALGGLTLDSFRFGPPAKGESDSSVDSGERIKEHLVRLARAELPPLMGDTYTAVVVTCLTCLDRDNEDFGDEEDLCDDDGILIGVRFIEKVLLRLNSISV